MIFLRGPNLLFIKPHKTASTSVEIALSCLADDGDIVTPLIPEDELTRFHAGGHLPVNWAWLKSGERRYLRDFARLRTEGKLPRRLLPGGRGKLYSKAEARFFNHITPAEIDRRGGGDMLRGAYLVSMVRHPFEQVVSRAWHHKALARGDEPIAAMIDLAIAEPSPNLPYLFSDPKPAFVIRYENMAEDLGHLSGRLNFDLAAHLPVTKGANRSSRAGAADLLSAAQKTRILTRDGAIFDAFGYSR